MNAACETATMLEHQAAERAHLLVLLASLREDAIDHALQAGQRASPELYARLGARGSQACREDIGYHLDFLGPALQTGDAGLFLAYLRWLAQVLDSRGVPLRSVGQSLHDLAQFFGERLGPAAEPIRLLLAEGRLALDGGVEAPGYDKPCPAAHAEARPYAGAALAGRREEAMALLTAALQREQQLPQVAVHVIQPAMYEVGRQWQNNSVTVAQEQLATALSQTWMAKARASAPQAPSRGLRAIFACEQRNRHALGLRMVADAFELDGWSVDHLGATSSDTLLARVRDTEPHLVGLSASLPEHLSGLREMVRTLRQALGAGCPRIAVGGLVINQFPGMADWIGAETLGADAVTAVSVAGSRIAASGEP